MSRTRRFAGAAVPGLVAAVAAAFVAALWAAPAAAQTCTGVTVTSLNFGAYDERDPAPLDATAEVRVTCDSGVGYRILLGAGTHSGGSFDPRRMAGGAFFLNYNLFVNQGRTQVWDDGTDPARFVSAAGDGTEKVHTVYGRVFQLQPVGIGSYTDAVAVSVIY